MATGNENTAVGYKSMHVANGTTSSDAFGRNSLIAATSGVLNHAFGCDALSSLTTGERNSALGKSAGSGLTTGVRNVCLGGYAGAYSMATASDNVLVGYEAGRSTTGNQNTLVGKGAGYTSSSGSDNVAVGKYAGYDLTTGDNNILIGVNAGRGSSPSGGLTTHDNVICMGNNDHASSYIKVAWTATSDERDKTDIQDITTGLNFVNQLKPKSFWFRKERGSDVKHGMKRLGFLAQDILALEESDPVVIDNLDLDHLKYKAEHLVPILVNAIKELSAKVTALESA